MLPRQTAWQTEEKGMKRKQIGIWTLLSVLLFTVCAYAAEEPVRIAFLDSGISCRHLDAAQVDAGENFVFPERDTEDRIGHGTATAGIVLGSAELGLDGVSPTAQVVPLVCYDQYPSGVSVPAGQEVLAAAIYAAVDRYDCRIINISMGVTGDSELLRQAVDYAESKNAVIVSAVGNANRTAPEKVFYPAAYDTVIGVGAADGQQAAAFSQRHGVAVLAPGTGLLTVTNRNAARAEQRSGTSYACAYVSGLCAEILRKEPSLRASEVRNRLYASALDLGTPGFDADTGWGLVTAPADRTADLLRFSGVTAGGLALYLSLAA